MFRFLFVGSIILISMLIARTADAQCWNCYVTAPFIVGPPVIIVQPAPVYVMPTPVLMQPAPAPVIIEQPPVYVAPPQQIAPPVIVETPRGRQCWKQYAGSDNWGQPMYINACN